MPATTVHPNRYTNALVPHHIRKLPIEMLEQVFIECARDNQYPSNIRILTVGDYDTTPDWINITYVCRLWRRISLACPYLWTHITTNLSHRWVLEFLKRSRKHPLILELSNFRSTFRDIKLVLYAHAFRVRGLYLGDVVVSNPVMLSELGSGLTVPAPLLEDLVLEVGRCEVQDDLFSGYAPRLRRLGLGDGMTISIDSPLLGHLRELEVQETYDADGLLKLLQHTPLLESLKVSDLVPGRQYSGVDVHLPHLSVLCIRLYDYRSFVGFFERLQMPPTVHFQIILCILRESSTEEYCAVLDVIADRVRGISKSVGPLCARLEIEPEKDWCIAWYPMRQTLDDAAVDRTPRRALREYEESWNRRCEHQCDVPFMFSVDPLFGVPRTYAHMMNDVQYMVGRLTDVHALQLNLTLPDDPEAVERLSEEGPLQYPSFETWIPILKPMSDVRTLKLTSDAVAGVLMALTPADSVGGSSQSPLLPKLSTLVIVKSELPDPKLYEYPPGLNIIGLLEACLSKRLKLGLQLEQLVIDDDDYHGQEHMECLRKYVKDMSYDTYARAEQAQSSKAKYAQGLVTHDSVGAEYQRTMMNDGLTRSRGGPIEL